MSQLGPEADELAELVKQGGEVTNWEYSVDEDGEMTWTADVVMPKGWQFPRCEALHPQTGARCLLEPGHDRSTPAGNGVTPAIGHRAQGDGSGFLCWDDRP